MVAVNDTAESGFEDIVDGESNRRMNWKARYYVLTERDTEEIPGTYKFHHVVKRLPSPRTQPNQPRPQKQDVGP